LTYWIGENHKNEDDGIQEHPSLPAPMQTWRVILPGVVLSPMTFDHKQLAQLADWEAVAIAMALPWSTSATSFKRRRPCWHDFCLILYLIRARV
jgi:hypothetical protein